MSPKTKPGADHGDGTGTDRGDDRGGSLPGRRGVLKVGAVGAAVAGVGLGGLDGGLDGAADETALASADLRAVAAVPGVLDLYINEGFVAMVDESLVYLRGFGERPTAVDDPKPSLTIAPRVFLADGRLVASRTYPLDAAVPVAGRPAPNGDDETAGGYSRIRRAHWASFFPERTIIAETGSRIRLRVHNRLDQPHTFEVPEVASTGPIAPGATATLSFRAPSPGTYVYLDPGNAPVERVLGLLGVLVVVARGARWKLAPGQAEFERQYVWLCQDIDPDWSRRAHAGERIDPEATPPLPRYFMLNGRSGFLSLGVSDDEHLNLVTHEETIPQGSARRTDVRNFAKPDGHGSIITGQMLRLVNAGVAAHQMHFHGNHVWTVRRNGVDFPRDLGRVDEGGHVVLQSWEDVVELDPLDRKEIMLPIRRPPETVDQVWDARDEDWHYPMHCHAEPSQTAAGGLYPGGLVADWILAGPEHETGTSTAPPHAAFASQAEFAVSQPTEGSPKTLFRQEPDQSLVRKFFNQRFVFPDGAEHEIWSFEDDTTGRGFPAPLVRATEGQMMHIELKPSKAAHTIHWHGMEPDPRNDGVGHTSFQVTGGYTYQWQPEPGLPGNPNNGAGGSYFYHCHVNTVLHVQMGMFGPLVIDPVVHPDHPVPEGARRSFVDGPPYDIATEMLLVPYSVDPRWHELSHAAGLSGEDVGLNRFDPKHFYILGGLLAAPPATGVSAPSQVRANVAGSGHPTLVRVLNANYSPATLRFTTVDGTPIAMAEMIAHDGRALRDTSRERERSRPPRDLGHPLLTHVLSFGAAERYDMLLHPPKAGTYMLHIDWHHWVTQKVQATRSLPVVAR